MGDSLTDRLKLLIPPEEVSSTVKRIAGEIRRDYSGKSFVLVGVLKGAFVFLADLAREIDLPLEIDFVQTESYGRRDAPSAKVRVTKDIGMDLEGRDVIIVEDIVDSGNTANTIVEHLGRKKPASLRLCALLVKGRPRVRVDYLGKTLGKGFVVGYGLDYKEGYRALPGIYVIDTRKGA